jgi:signal transduction histidine kinase
MPSPEITPEPPGAPAAAPARFRLTRHYAIASFFAITTVLVALVLLYEYVAAEVLVRVGEQKNVAVTRVLLNALAPALLDELAPTDPGRGGGPDLSRLRAEVLRQTRGLSVVRVKIYGLDGRTLFSTEPVQIGEDQSRNPGFLAAASGRVSSELVLGARFSAFERAIENRDLASSYIPLRGPEDRVLAVFEVYDDLTPLMEEVHRLRHLVIGTMAALLLALYGALAWIVRRGDRLIRRHQRLLEEEVAIRRRAEAAARDAGLAAERANRAKSEFVAHMSHELRTPLNAIIGFSEAMEREVHGPLGVPRYREYAADIRASGGHLLEIVNDVLDMAKIEAGRFELEFAPVEAAPLIASCCRMVRQRAESAGVALETEVAPDLPRLRGDERALKQILINLLGNAIKFTPPGGRVAISARAAEAAIRLEVADTGPGIAEADLARVLEPYVQSEEGRRTGAGTGLGLAIVRDLVGRHDGRFELASRPGEGTRATVEIPVAG